MIEKKINTQVIFIADTKYGKLTDSIVFDSSTPMDEKQIDEEINNRVASYESIIDNPPKVEELTEEEITKQLAAIEADLSSLQSMKVSYEAKAAAILVAKEEIVLDEKIIIEVKK